MSLQAVVRSSLTDIADKPLYLAYSGGIDSQCLLHVLASLRDELNLNLTAVHIHHGLQKAADEWLAFCQQQAARLDVSFLSRHCELRDINQSGVESAARQARYQALAAVLPAGAVLLTAQHRDDQAETLLLQLLRGAGPKGLAAMPANGMRFGMQVRRPLLTVGRQQIKAYAHEHKLDWREDPSNQDVRFNRNYLRHRLMPVIQERWSQASQTLARSAGVMAESQQLLIELAEQDMTQVNVSEIERSVDLQQLAKLSAARQRNLLRFLLGHWQLAFPSYQKLDELRDVMLNARVDAQPLVVWADVFARRYLGRLYFTKAISEIESAERVQLNPPPEATILDKNWQLSWHQSRTGISEQFLTQPLHIEYRAGGEQFKPAGERHSKPLKHWLQIWRVPPWQRQRTPLIYSGEKLLVVVGYAIAAEASTEPESQGWEAVLKPVHKGPI